MNEVEIIPLEILMHRLSVEEVKNQYFSLIAHLSDTPMVSNQEFETQINKVNRIGIIMVCYKEKIIGSGTLLFEPKLSHGCKYVGHIEDIIVDPEHRGLGIASTIIEELKNLSQPYCYKLILHCKEELKEFYKKNGFVSSDLFIMKYEI